MARKPRDYKAEERRRNELARARGFKTRASQRGAIERGEIRALQPARVRSPRVKKAQAKFLSGPAAPRGPIPSYAELERALSADLEQQCWDWAARHAVSTVAQYGWTDEDKKWKKGEPWVRRNNATNKQKIKWIEKHGKEAYTQAYYNAFVDGPERYSKNRYNGGSDAMRLWYVEITGYMTAEEFESRYGAHV